MVLALVRMRGQGMRTIHTWLREHFLGVQQSASRRLIDSFVQISREQFGPSRFFQKHVIRLLAGQHAFGRQAIAT